MGLFGKKEKTGYWIIEEHLFGGSTFECSACHVRFKGRKASRNCPACHARMTRSRYDPRFVDELEFLDAIFDD